MGAPPDLGAQQAEPFDSLPWAPHRDNCSFSAQIQHVPTLYQAWGAQQEIKERQGPPTSSTLAASHSRCNVLRRLPRVGAPAHPGSPQGNWWTQVISITHIWGREPASACHWTSLPSRPRGHLPEVPSLTLPEASIPGYKTQSFEPPALIAGSDYSHSFRANSRAKWSSPKPISCLAGYGMFFPSK